MHQIPRKKVSFFFFSFLFSPSPRRAIHSFGIQEVDVNVVNRKKETFTVLTLPLCLSLFFNFFFFFSVVCVCDFLPLFKVQGIFFFHFQLSFLWEKRRGKRERGDENKVPQGKKEGQRKGGGGMGEERKRPHSHAPPQYQPPHLPSFPCHHPLAFQAPPVPSCPLLLPRKGNI